MIIGFESALTVHSLCGGVYRRAKGDPQPALTRLGVVQYAEKALADAGCALSPSLYLFRGCSVSIIPIVCFSDLETSPHSKHWSPPCVWP